MSPNTDHLPLRTERSYTSPPALSLKKVRLEEFQKKSEPRQEVPVITMRRKQSTLGLTKPKKRNVEIQDKIPAKAYSSAPAMSKSRVKRRSVDDRQYVKIMAVKLSSRMTPAVMRDYKSLQQENVYLTRSKSCPTIFFHKMKPQNLPPPPTIAKMTQMHSRARLSMKFPALVSRTQASKY